MKTIYLVPYWVPFPSSEYGGVQVVIADGKAEARQLIADASDDYDRKAYPDYEKLIEKCLKRAVSFPVDSEQSGIVYDFTT